MPVWLYWTAEVYRYTVVILCIVFTPAGRRRARIVQTEGASARSYSGVFYLKFIRMSLHGMLSVVQLNITTTATGSNYTGKCAPDIIMMIA